jgi:hypothetical protein
MLAVNEHLASIDSFAAFVFPTAGKWIARDKKDEELNVVCANKATILSAIYSVQTARSECGKVLTQTVLDLETGCKQVLAAGTACDKCLVGVASLVRMLPEVDTTVQARFGGQHCGKIDGVATSLGACSKVCNANVAARELATAVVADAEAGLARDGECDVK